MTFWEEPQGAARLKLGILKRYLGIFASKTGSSVADKRVCYFDGFAGRGFYDDGSAGSPATAVSAVEIYRKRPRYLDGFLVEKDEETFEILRGSADEGGWGQWQLRLGEASEYVDEMLTWAENSPLLAFVDPFALGIPFQGLLRIMKRAPATEVLLNVSKHGIRRFSGHLTGKDHKARKSFINKLDVALGGTWWQEHVLEREANNETARLIAFEYCRKISEEVGCGHYIVPVHDRLDGPVDYFLLLLTKHPDGLWFFNEAVSNTVEDEKKHQADTGGQFYFDETDAYVSAITSNIAGNLAEFKGTKLGSGVGRLYGDTIGLARSTHVRKALYRLHSNGTITNSPKGVKDLSRFRIELP